MQVRNYLKCFVKNNPSLLVSTIVSCKQHQRQLSQLRDSKLGQMYFIATSIARISWRQNEL